MYQQKEYDFCSKNCVLMWLMNLVGFEKEKKSGRNNRTNPKER